MVVAEGELGHNGVFQVHALGFPPVEPRAKSLAVAKARRAPKFRVFKVSQIVPELACSACPDTLESSGGDAESGIRCNTCIAAACQTVSLSERS